MNCITETSPAYIGYRTTLYYESIIPGEYRQLTFVEHESPECPQEGLNTLEERKNRYIAFLEQVRKQPNETCVLCGKKLLFSGECESNHI